MPNIGFYLLDEVKRLSVAERIELAEAIWDTVAEDAGADVLPVSEAHRRELDRRLADLEADPGSGSSWEEVRCRLERLSAVGEPPAPRCRETPTRSKST